MKKIVALALGFISVLIFLEIGLLILGAFMSGMQWYWNSRMLKSLTSPHRILCLGDSMTYFQYPMYLKEYAQKKHPGTDIEMIDRGMPGADANYVLSIAPDALKKYSPDIIILMVGVRERLPDNDCRSEGIILPRCSMKIMKLISYIERDLFYKIATRKTISPFKNSSRRPLHPVVPSPSELKYFALTSEQKHEFQDAMGKGKYYLAQNDYSRAQAFFKYATTIAPDHEAYMLLLIVNRKLHEESQSKSIITFLLRSYDRDYKMLSLAGWFYSSELNDPVQAEKYLESSITLNPYDLYTYTLLIDAYRVRGETGKISDTLNKGFHLIGMDERLLGMTAIFYLENKQYAVADRYFYLVDEYRRRTFDPKAILRLYAVITQYAREHNAIVVAMQYPLCGIRDLKEILRPMANNVMFVDNDALFKNALKHMKYNDLFRDNYAGNFGHCTERGNRMIAQNIVDTLFR